MRSVGPKPYCPVRDRVSVRLARVTERASGLGHLPCAREGGKRQTPGSLFFLSVFLQCFSLRLYTSNATQMLSGACIASKLDPSPFGSAAQTERIDARHAWRASGDRVQHVAAHLCCWSTLQHPVLVGLVPRVRYDHSITDQSQLTPFASFLMDPALL